ncbi:MAG TPA: hypothetical protein VK936_13795 [Longimicrobiales bacterium]|nr:hypothetical protein [Longimicrobiales bacterium]
MAAVLVAAAGAAPAAASPAGEPTVAPGTWTAWYGCWRAVGDAGTADGMVCVLPGADAASARMVTLEDGVIVDESVVSADGRTGRVEEGGCTGTHQARWSRDGRRVFLSAEMDCDGVRRVSSGVIAMVSESEWLDVQAVSVAGRDAVRTLRYRPARDEDVPASMTAALADDRTLRQEAARLHASAPMDGDAVIEAAGAVAPAALEALVASQGHAWTLDAATLVRLSDAGVPPSVLDMMIAVSYPQRFAVAPREEPRYPDRAPRVARYRDDCMDTYYSPYRRYRTDCALLYGVAGYGFGYRYMYSPWGYDPYGWGYGYQPVVIVRPDGPRSGGDSLVRGRGYTRGGTGSTGTAQPRSSGSRGNPSTSSSPSVQSSPPSSGTDSGSSGGSSGRTARPRDGGGQ